MLNESEKSVYKEDPEEAIRHLADRIIADNCVLFLGTSCSGLTSIPNRNTFAFKLLDSYRNVIDPGEENNPKKKNGADLYNDFEYLCGKYSECSSCISSYISILFEQSKGRPRLIEMVEDHFSSSEYRNFYSALWNFNFETIYTVNFDEQFEKAVGPDGVGWEKRLEKIVSDDDLINKILENAKDGFDVNNSKSKRSFFYKLRGSLGEDGHLVLTLDDKVKRRRGILKSDIKSNSMLWKRLEEDFSDKKTFLFIGNAFSDPDVLEALLSARARTGNSSDFTTAYVLIEEPVPWKAKFLAARLRLQILEQNTEEFLDKLHKGMRETNFELSLEENCPDIWSLFVESLERDEFFGMSFFGKGYRQRSSKDSSKLIEGALNWIVGWCQKNEENVTVRLKVSAIGKSVYLGCERFINLLDIVCKQIKKDLDKLNIEFNFNEEIINYRKKVGSSNEQTVVEDCSIDFFDYLKLVLNQHPIRLVVVVDNFNWLEIEKEYLSWLQAYFFTPLTALNTARLVLGRCDNQEINKENYPTISTYTLSLLKEYKVSVLEGE